MQGTKIASLWMSALSPHPSFFFLPVCIQSSVSSLCSVGFSDWSPLRPSVPSSSIVYECGVKLRRAFFSECVDKVSLSVLNLPWSHMVYTFLWPQYLGYIFCNVDYVFEMSEKFQIISYKTWKLFDSCNLARWTRKYAAVVNGESDVAA